MYGARPLKRVIQTLVENELAVQIIKATVHDGDRIVVDLGGGRLVFGPATHAGNGRVTA